MNQEKKRLNLIGLILLAQAIVLSLATTLFAEILQNDVWIGIASTLIALLIPCFFMGFKNLKKTSNGNPSYNHFHHYFILVKHYIYY